MSDILVPTCPTCAQYLLALAKIAKTIDKGSNFRVRLRPPCGHQLKYRKDKKGIEHIEYMKED